MYILSGTRVEDGNVCIANATKGLWYPLMTDSTSDAMEGAPSRFLKDDKDVDRTKRKKLLNKNKLPKGQEELRTIHYDIIF